MARYLYTYIHLFGFMGCGTAENPGTDFAMSVWIDADNAEEARRWGNVLLADYIRARFQHSETRFTPANDAWIEENEEQICYAQGLNYPVCRAGEIPIWLEPWRDNNSQRPSSD